MKLFAPATNLMKTLNYPKKFALISFIFILPLGVSMALLFAEIQSQIQFAQKERLGTQYLRSVHELANSFKRYRVANDRLSRTAQPISQMMPLLAEVTKDLQQLERVEQQLGKSLKTGDRVTNIQKNWTLLKQQSHEFSPETEEFLGQQISAAIDDLRLQVGDQSNLILDPNLDTYYLIGTVVQGKRIKNKG